MPHGLFTSAAHYAGFSTMTGLICLTLLAGCTPGVRAPIVDLSTAPTSARPAPNPIASQADSQTAAKPLVNGAYVVQRGDTLYGIARSAGVSTALLAEWNKLNNPAQLRVGQVLTLSDPAQAASAQPEPVTQKPTQSSVSSRPPVAVTPPVQTAPPAESQPAPPSTSPAPTPPAPTPPVANVAGILWAWPASGNVIQAFSATTKGIDIAGAPGDPVRAAADGKVMYSGNGVRGLGNLLIINHQDGFITAYAHNRILMVKTGQTVKRGDKIAELGQTDTTSPRLHFELRRQGTPVNPLQYLPKR